MSDLVERLRSFADYHEDLWPEKGMGIAQAVMREAINRIEELEAEKANILANTDASQLRLVDIAKERQLRINELEAALTMIAEVAEAVDNGNWGDIPYTQEGLALSRYAQKVLKEDKP